VIALFYGVYPFVQRHFTEGVIFGAVKGWAPVRAAGRHVLPPTPPEPGAGVLNLVEAR